MAHPFFGREGRMGMGTVFRKDGREGGPSEKNGRYPSLAARQWQFPIALPGLACRCNLQDEYEISE